MRLLVLEDDSVLALALTRYLDRHDHVGHAVATMAEARAALAVQRYDCLVLDRMVPDGDALDLVSELHAQPERPPMLVLSGLGDTAERIKGLGLGADEYMSKPARMDEVVLRVSRLVARAAATGEDAVRLGQVVLDRSRRQVSAGGREIHLSPRQYCVFNYLMAHRGRVVGIDELLEHCWDGDRSFFANPIHSQINALRQIFDGLLRFEAVRGVGYVAKEVARRLPGSGASVSGPVGDDGR